MRVRLAILLSALVGVLLLVAWHFRSTKSAVAPPPHIRGQLASVRVTNPDFEETTAMRKRTSRESSNGAISCNSIFGKLTMRHVDLIMVDLSNHAWFDQDLAHYQDQLVKRLYAHDAPGRHANFHAEPGPDTSRQKSKH
jgi:hypothetical protein